MNFRGQFKLSRPEKRDISALVKRMTGGQKQQVELKLMFGALDRAATICLFFAFAFPIYALTNYPFTLQIDPSIKIWSNFWKQVLIAGLPFLCMFLAFRQYRTKTKIKMWVWSLGYPLILAGSNMINIWPLMLAGHSEVYMNVHAACFVATIMGMSLVAAPPKFLYTTVAMTMATFVGPVCWIFYKTDHYNMIQFVINDACYALILGALCARTTFRLRHRLAVDDVLNQQKIEKFVGNIVSQSIFQNDDALLNSRVAQGFLISLDVRGYTQMTKEMDAVVARQFKERYHKLVATAVGEKGGFIHKTHGDGHLVSLGLMNSEEESLHRDDVVGVEGQLALKRAKHMQKAISIFETVFEQFEHLKIELNVDSKICVCASIDYGEIGLNILGDPNVRLEFDIDGLVVIRCSRLEAFTKRLREVFSDQSSYLVVSSAASSYIFEDRYFHVFKTKQHPIKDFPDEEFVTYREYKSFKANFNKVG